MSKPVGSVERRRQISVEEFTRSYLARNRPLIVADAGADWPASRRWTHDFMRKQFGGMTVSLQGDFFGRPLCKMRLDEYIDSFDELEARVGSDGSVSSPPPYLRYDDGSSTFVTTAQAALRDDWSRPYFLPQSLYVYPPHLVAPDPRTTRYPDFGVYISPRGALTKLHLDRGRTNAILCQVRGVKRLFLYEPALEARLPRDWARRPRENLNLDRIPPYEVPPTFDALLHPGEAIFIPRSWFHEVYTIERSISITYNFVHLRDAFTAVGRSRTWLMAGAQLALEHGAGRAVRAVRKRLLSKR